MESGWGKHPNSQEALENNRKATQFGGERGNPQAKNNAGNHPGSVRMSVRYLAKQPAGDIDGAVKIELPKEATYAQLIAARRIEDALNASSASDRLSASEYVTEQVDGKLAQTNINAELAALGSMSMEELRDYRKQIAARRAELESAGSAEDGNSSGTAGAEADRSAADGEPDQEGSDPA